MLPVPLRFTFYVNIHLKNPDFITDISNLFIF